MWGFEAFFGRLSGDGTEFWALVTAYPPIGGYGSDTSCDDQHKKYIVLF